MAVLWLLLLAACVAEAPPPVTTDPDGDHDGVPDVEDCAPADPLIPAAVDDCDGVDQDCDGVIDEDAAATTWYGDADGDGAGDAETTLTSCAAPEGYVATPDDCDPGDGKVYPGAPELCDGIDQDCDGDWLDVTESGGEQTWHLDADADGWGVTSTTVESCFPPEGYVTRQGDCDDADPAVNPGAPEVCDDADLDENCNGVADDDDWAAGTTAGWTDQDGDGWGTTLVWRCDPDPAVADQEGDCDDTDATVSPGAEDTCGDGLDQDCDGEDAAC